MVQLWTDQNEHWIYYNIVKLWADQNEYWIIYYIISKVCIVMDHYYFYNCHRDHVGLYWAVFQLVNKNHFAEKECQLYSVLRTNRKNGNETWVLVVHIVQCTDYTTNPVHSSDFFLELGLLEPNAIFMLDSNYSL